jgi:hypothetical protein
MQKTVVTIQGMEVPLIIRHEDKTHRECETVVPLEIPGGITLHPGALLRIPVSGLMPVNPSARSYAVIHPSPKA